MKQFYVAAGALLLGTSAIAWAADNEASKNPIGESVADQSAMSLEAESQIAIDKQADSRWSASHDTDAGMTATMDKAALGQPAAAKLEAGNYADWSDEAAQAKLAYASANPQPMGDTTQSASLDKADAVHTGVGGPIEQAELTPRPAAGNYPPCDPGPGDDNCIQLYESGVRAQLASWNAPTGGLADGSSTTAMGGPFEPVADHAQASATGAMHADAAMNDRTIDTSVAEPQGVPLGTAVSDVDAQHQGVGGPVESQSGYPPCEPGPGDDRCIQLYERGVTGAGN
jgi:hypothetical protein